MIKRQEILNEVLAAVAEVLYEQNNDHLSNITESTYL